MNHIEEGTFTVQLTLDESSQENSFEGYAAYKLKCPDWIKLDAHDYLIAVSAASIPAYAMDLCTNGEYYVEVNRLTIGGEQSVKCVFSNITTTNPELFVREITRQMSKCQELDEMFVTQDVPKFTYSRDKQFVSVHFRDTSPDQTRPSLMRLSPKLSAKLGFSLLQQPFASSQAVGGVAWSTLPLYIFRGHENIHISTPSLVQHGILVNSTWTSVLATCPVNYLEHLDASASYADQYHQLRHTYEMGDPTFFKCTVNEIREWHLMFLLDDLSIIRWAYPNLNFSVTLKFKRAPRIDFA